MARSTRGTVSLVAAIALIAALGVTVAPSGARAAIPSAADYQLSLLPAATFSAAAGPFTYGRSPDHVNNGIVIGSVHGSTAYLRGFVWNRGVLTELGHGTGADAVPEAINASGLIVGETYAINGGVSDPVGVTWSASNPAAATALLVPAGAPGVQPKFVNDSGQIVAQVRGSIVTGDSTAAGWYFYASPTAAPQLIGGGLTTGQSLSGVQGLTNAGVLLTSVHNSDGSYASIVLPSFDASDAGVTALDFAPTVMSPNGTIAGYVGSSAFLGHGVLRSAVGVQTALAARLTPTGVNDSGAVVGESASADGQTNIAVLLQDGVTVPVSTLIPPSTFASVYAAGIDNEGNLIGSGSTPGSTDINQSAGYVLRSQGLAAAFTSAPASKDPGVVQFVSTTPVPPGDTLVESWDFGDGATGDGSVITHTYTKPGTFHVALTETNQVGGTSTVTHDVVIAAPTLSSTIAFVDSAGAPLDTVSPKVGDTVQYKLTLAASQDGVGNLSGVAFVGDPLTIASGASSVTLSGPVPRVPADITLKPGDSTSFIVTATLQSTGVVKATTQAAATDSSGETVTSDQNQISFGVQSLSVELTLNPPSYVAEIDPAGPESGPKPHNVTVTEKITNVTDQRLSSVNVRSIDVLRTHAGQLLNSQPTEGSIVPDPDTGYPVGSLDPGQSVTIAATFTLNADGHVQFQSLVTASKPDQTTVRGLGSAILSIGVGKVLEFTSRVVNVNGTALLPAGTPITITGTVHNLSDSAKLDVGPLFATTIGNAGVQSLTYDGVGVSPRAFVVPGPLTLQPGDTKTFTLKVLTSYSEPDGSGGVIRSGGTSATMTFTPWAHVTLDDGTEYDTDEAGTDILSTPADLSRRVAIDDSIAIPDYGPVENARIIGGAIMYGGVEGTWNAASGMVTGLINLPNVSASTLWAAVNFQTKVWESFTPEERDAFANETSYMIVSVLERNVTLAKEGTPALLKQASDYVENYLTKLENSSQTGQWAEVTSIYSSGAANAIGQVVIPIAIGKLASSSEAVSALDATQAELQAKTALIAERSNGAVTAEQLVPLLNDLATGAEVSPELVTKLFGMTAAELAEFQNLATKYKFLLTVRARSATSIDWIEAFHAAVKPEALKIKTVSPLDVRLGYPADKVGSLIFKEPVPLIDWKAAGAKSGDISGFVERYVTQQGFVPGTDDYYSAIFRVSDRIGEWNQWESTYFQWDHQGWVDTTFSWKAQDFIPPEGSGPKLDGFNLEPISSNPNDGYIVKLYSEQWGAYVPVTGDIDLVSFSHLDGTQLTPDEFVSLLSEMHTNELIQAQHGPAETYTNGGLDFIESNFKPNEPGLQIAPTGIPPRVVRLNTGASNWMSANNKHIVWDGSIVTTGNNPAVAPATLNIDYNAALHLDPAPTQEIQPLPGNGIQGANVGRCRVTYSTGSTSPLLLLNARGEINQLTGGALTASPYQTTCFSAGPTIDLPVKPATVTAAPVTAGTHEVPIATPGPVSAGPSSSSGFVIGQTVIIDPGTPQEETAVISGFGSLIFRDGLKFDHPAGSTIIVASTPTATAAAALAMTGSAMTEPLLLGLLLILFGGTARFMSNRRRRPTRIV